MYFNEKEDTNIDKEFKEERDFSTFKKPLIIIGTIILLIIIILIIVALTKNKKHYFITLEGNQEMTIYQGAAYNEPGYIGFDNKQNKYDVNVSGEVDSSKIGTYTLTYELNGVTATRTVNVVAKPSVVTTLHLIGSKSMIIKKGSTWKDPGYTAIDVLEGNITNKVTINGKVNTSKKGTYKLTYSVINSNGVTTSETRIVVVE